MIEGIETYYQRIADAMVDKLPFKWRTAKVDVVFYPNSGDYDCEFVNQYGRLFDLGVDIQMAEMFQELREKFKEAGKPLWGQATFELNSNGQFNMKWGYDNCDKDGSTIWNPDEWSRKQEERSNRLNSQGSTGKGPT